MPKAEATLLPPAVAPEDRDSSRTLEDVGPLAVLTAMVEQKRRSIPPACEVEPIEDDPTSEELAETERAPKHSNSYIKTR